MKYSLGVCLLILAQYSAAQTPSITGVVNAASNINQHPARPPAWDWSLQFQAQDFPHGVQRPRPGLRHYRGELRQPRVRVVPVDH
jgi:hypothetical protein